MVVSIRQAYGGGIAVIEYSTLTIEECDFRENAVVVRITLSWATSTPPLDLKSSLLCVTRKADLSFGGALWAQTSYVDIKGTTFFNNTGVVVLEGPGHLATCEPCMLTSWLYHLAPSPVPVLQSRGAEPSMQTVQSGSAAKTGPQQRYV